MIQTGLVWPRRTNGGLDPVKRQNNSEFHDKAIKIMTNSAVAGISIRDTAARDLCQIHVIYEGRWCEKLRSIT
jgi:hypothetical protein